MLLEKIVKSCAMIGITMLMVGCMSMPKDVDYTAFKQCRPQSILILPPLNNSPDVNASYSLLSQMTYPLAEIGYYVFPVTLVNETFKENGLTSSAEIYELPTAKLYDIFGADTALYTTISEYGASYKILSSSAVVTATARLVDLKSGATLWEGTASASSDEGKAGGGGLMVMLITAVIEQIVHNVTDSSHKVAGMTCMRLLGGGTKNGILYGPRSPHYEKEGK